MPKNDRGGKSKKARKTQPAPVAHSYQEGSVDSIGSTPSGTDTMERTGDGTLPSRGGKVKAERGRDAFVSTDVTDKTSVPGKGSRTRS